MVPSYLSKTEMSGRDKTRTESWLMRRCRNQSRIVQCSIVVAPDVRQTIEPNVAFAPADNNDMFLLIFAVSANNSFSSASTKNKKKIYRYFFLHAKQSQTTTCGDRQMVKIWAEAHTEQSNRSKLLICLLVVHPLEKIKRKTFNQHSSIEIVRFAISILQRRTSFNDKWHFSSHSSSLWKFWSLFATSATRKV